MKIPFTEFEIARRMSAQLPDTGRSLRGPLHSPVLPDGVLSTENLNRAAERILDYNDTLTRAARSYEAALTDDYNSDMPGTWGSANTEYLGWNWKMRARTRTLAKDDAHGKAAVRAVAQNVVGDDPFKLDMEVGSKNAAGKFEQEEDTNQAIEQWWHQAGRSENWTTTRDMTRLEFCLIMEAAAFRDGGCIVRLYNDYPLNEDGCAIKLQEIDRLPEWNNGVSRRGNPIRESVEYHPVWDCPLYYHILTQHPSEYMGALNPKAVKAQFEEVPAEEVLLYKNLRTRAEQRQGVTEMDAIVQPLWRNKQYLKSYTVAAIRACIMCFVLEKKLPTGLQMPPEMLEQMANGFGGPGSGASGLGGEGAGEAGNPAADQQGQARRVQVLKPGAERELPFGVESKILQPQFPIEGAHEFNMDNLRTTAQGAGISYQDQTGDYQNLGFAAALMSQTGSRLNYKIRQKIFADLYRRLFKWRMRNAMLTGALDFSPARLNEFEDAAKFKPHRWPFVNPLVQMQELILGLEEKIYSPQEVQDMLPNGKSIEDLYKDWDDAKAEAAKYGLLIDAVDADLAVTKKGDPGQGDPAPNASEPGQPPAKSKTSNPAQGAARPGAGGREEGRGKREERILTSDLRPPTADSSALHSAGAQRRHGRRGWRREQTLRMIAEMGDGRE